MGITWRHRIPIEVLKQKTRVLIGKYGQLLELARRRKRQRLCQTYSNFVEDARGRGRPKRTRLTDIADMTVIGITTGMREAEDWQNLRKIAKSSKCPNGQQRLHELQ